MIEITLPGEVPSKKNSRTNTRSGRSFPSGRYVRWHDMAVLASRAQSGGITAPVPCGITVTFVHGSMRRRDGDNGLSSVLDMLVDAGILADDSWREVSEMTVYNRYDRGNAMCRVVIRGAA